MRHRNRHGGWVTVGDMNTRPRLISSIPFWVLLVASLAAVASGVWVVLDRLERISTAILTQTPEAVIEVYQSQSTIIVGAVVLGAGLVGLLITLGVAALSTLRTQPEIVVEEIDWTSDDETAVETDAPVLVDDEPVVVSEAPDVETPTDAPAPERARD
jgi:hypothetical protein